MPDQTPEPLTGAQLQTLAEGPTIRAALARELIDARSRIAGLEAAVRDERGGRRIAGEAANRFRDVIAEALDLSENPGDEQLVAQLRVAHGKTGPEPRRWRDFLAEAMALVENQSARWAADPALNEEPASD